MEYIPCAKYLCYIGNHSANSHKSPEAPKIISHILQVTKPKLRGYMVKNRSGIQTQPKTHCLTTVIHYPGSPGRDWEPASNACSCTKEGKLKLWLGPEEPQLGRGGGKAQGPHLKPRRRRASQRKNPDRNRKPYGAWEAAAAAGRALESRRRTWWGRPKQVD